jgi:UDP-N-acetylglucosamine 2-epimerase (non-hydrolysing)
MEYLAIGESFSGRLNPYGDGRASARIVAALTGQAFEEFGAGAASPVRLGQPLAPTSAASQ